MCRCTPNMKTPFCGKGDCKWPEPAHSHSELKRLAVIAPIRPARPEDVEWVRPIFDVADHVLGKGFFGTIWWRFWNQRNGEEHWVVIPKLGFAHFKVRKDGWKVVYEIATAPEAKRQGVGRRLLDFIGTPMELKTDADHEESNAFYRRCGFYPAGLKRSRDGKKRLRIWVKPCAP